MSDPRQEWLEATALARYCGVTTKTVREWIYAGIIRAAQVQTRHYSDQRLRATGRGRWRIHVDDVRDFLVRWRLSGAHPGSKARPSRRMRPASELTGHALPASLLRGA